MNRSIRKASKLLLFSTLGILILLFLLFISVWIGIFGPLPSIDELKEIHNEEASLVYSSDHVLLGKYFAENRTNISIEEIPEHLIQALIATEDKRFFEHEGYDTRSYLRVIFKTLLLRDKSSGGGSTITQQLVKNLYGRKNHSILSLPVSKLKEAIIASRLEDVYCKEEILVLYLNSVPFGEEVFGVEAASIRYFNKSAKELKIQESAVLIGILKANTYYNPRMNPENAISRRNQILALMYQQNYISIAEKDSLQNSPLNLSYSNYSIYSPASYFVNQVKDEVKEILKNISVDELDMRKDGLKIYTSLNSQIQEFALESRKNQLERMQKLLDQQLRARKIRQKWAKSLPNFSEERHQKKNREVFDWDGIQSQEMSIADSLWHYYKMLHAAVLIVEPKSGRVISWVGGNHFRYLPYDMIYAKRQAASAIKPLIYAAALEKNMNPCTYLENEEKDFENYQNWRPKNYNREHTPDSTVSIWFALANSMNLPTVDLYFKTGHQQISDLLRRLGFDPPLNETPAISLGAIDVSLYEMVQAYSAIANGGNYIEQFSLVDSISDSRGNIIYKNPILEIREALDEPVAEEITEILQIAINQGTGTAIRNRFGIKSDLAGKTGTAQNYSNAWFMSYTQDLVVGVWVGASSPEIHFYNGLGSGSSLALPISGSIWKEIELNDELREVYLIPFQNDSTFLDLTACPPYHEKGVDGFLHRLFNGSEEINLEKDTSQELSRKEKRLAKKAARKEKRKKKEKTKVGKFLQNIFGGKDGEKNK